jgi:hypothetical protein
MLLNALLAVAALAASAQAFEIPTFFQRRQAAACPQVWYDISGELNGIFLSDGQCNDAARAAIRGVFHDCFPQGGCDGSLAIADEIARPANTPMATTVNALKVLAAKYNVGVADMLMFAGSHAVATCPSGPIVQTLVGRKDATVAAPDGQLPAANVAGDDALSHFQAAGFDAKDLAALIGAHTVSRQFVTAPDIAGTSQDTTPGIWDILYYVQTIAKTAPFTFISDINLANQNQVGPWMQRFSTDKAAWDVAFTSAMARLELLGNDKSSMVDCTDALPKKQAKSRRDVKRANIFARAR